MTVMTTSNEELVRDAFASLAPPAPPRVANLVTMGTVEAQVQQWLRPGRIAADDLTLVFGDGGTGKSFWAMDLAARVSTGRPFPDDLGSTYPPGDVILLSAEDRIDTTIANRLNAAEADNDRINTLASVL